MTTAPLLIELLTEELPPKSLKKLGEAFANGINEGLAQVGLVGAGASLRIFATPRRLGVLLHDVRSEAENRQEIRKLMPSKVAFGPEGKPTAALLKKLEKEGIDPGASFERRVDGDAENVYASFVVKGAALESALQSIIDGVVQRLPIAKVMSYQLKDGETTVKFVRPAHNLLVLHGAKALDISVLGLRSKDNYATSGHRFLSSLPIKVENAELYELVLTKKGFVIPDFKERRSAILKALGTKCEELGLRYVDLADEPFMEEVTGLVEYPVAYVCSFDEEFLSVPAECLVLTMKQNQKYFPLVDSQGALTNRFLIISNMEVPNPENIIQGNERVVRPRLSDARFFFETDKKTKLADRMTKLGSVVYHNKLGTQLERTERVAKLAGAIASSLGADATKAERAARLAKCDLVTDMVGEFPELQGTMGRYYALHDGEAPEVADAIAQHYQPRFSGDALPQHPVSLTVALADKMETLVGMFATGNQPTGDRDPFGLRRAALGVVRILVERQLDISLSDLINEAFVLFQDRKLSETHTDLETFVLDRMSGYLRDRGHSSNEVESVMCLRPIRLWRIPIQIEAVCEFKKLPEAESLAAANKRVANILKKSDVTDVTLDAARMVESAEKALWSALQTTTPQADALFAANDYAGYLKSFAALKAPVDEFFEKVMVNAEDANIRNNRLALLRELRDAMNRVADLSKLAT